MKCAYFLLLMLVTNTAINGMKRPLEIIPISHSLITLDNDCLRCIYTYINPTWNNWKKNSKNLYSAANNIKQMTLINKAFHSFFSLTRIASLLQVDYTNKDIFLLRAAQAGIPCLVQHAIDSNADVNYSKKNEFQPLTITIIEKNHICARLLLTAKASIIQPPIYFPVNYQPIHLAVSKGDLKMTKLLLEFKANPNEKTQFGYTPVKLALMYNHARIAKLLIKHKAIVQKRDKPKLQELLATLKPVKKKQKNNKIKTTSTTYQTYASPNAHQSEDHVYFYLSMQGHAIHHQQ